MSKLVMSFLAALLISSPVFAGKLLKVPRTKVPTVKRIKFDQDRLVVLRGPVTEFSARPVIDKLTALDLAENKPIWLIINSPGGSVVDGFEIITAIQALKSPLTCIVESQAYSMAAMISAYCPRLYMHQFSNIMFHEASYSVQGNESIVKSRVNAIEKYLDQGLRNVARQLGLTLPEFRQLILTEWWMTSREAVRAGIADGIVLELQYTSDPPKQTPFFPLSFEKGWIVKLDIKL